MITHRTDDNGKPRSGLNVLKILLISPPYSQQSLIFKVFEPLALEILGATVRNHDVRILDMRFERFSSLDRFLKTFSPDLVGITVSSTTQVNGSLRIFKHIKQTNGAVQTAVGGNHPTLVPEDFYTPDVDVVFLGLAEKSFPAYVNALASGGFRDEFDGVQVLEQGRPKKPSATLSIFDPSEIPLPDRNLTKEYRHKYRDELRRPTAMVSTARGCPFRCTFCACWKATGGRYLARQAEQVVDELESIPPDVPHVFFADDNTFHDIARAERLHRLIKERGIHKSYSAYARSDTVVKCPDLFRRWKEIGLDTLIIGFEATSDRRLKELNKGNVTEKNEKAVEILYDLGIRIRSYLMIDPDFEKADFREVSDYYKRLNLVTPIFSTLTPLPGTRLYEQKKSQINMSYDYFDCIHWVVPTRMDARVFFNQYARLYMGAYSFRRHIGIMVRKQLHALRRGNRVPDRQFRHLGIAELLVLWVLVLLQGWKVYKHYFAFKRT